MNVGYWRGPVGDSVVAWDSVTGRARLVTEPDILARVVVALDAKYAPFRTQRTAMPPATRAHYEVALATIEVAPDEHILSWDNARLGLHRAPR